MYVDVALPLPLPRTFTYRVPPALAAAARPGARVLVPFANRERIGWIDRVSEAKELRDPEKVKAVLGVLDAAPTATPSILRLCRWIADYYLAPLGVVLRAALPMGLTDSSTDYVQLSGDMAPGRDLTRQEAKLLDWLRAREVPQPVLRLRRELGDREWWPTIRRLEEMGLIRVETAGPRIGPPVRTHRVLRLLELPSLMERDTRFGRAKRQREAFETVEAMGGRAEVSHLVQLGFSYEVIKGLVAKGAAEIAEEEVSRDPYAGVEVRAPTPHRPTPAQAAAIAELVRATQEKRPGTFLLRGVTGSGKTLVYIELLREVVERQGKTAIVLVPEIALTPQTVGRFKAVFGDRVAVLHSAL
ncbi:MAG TPA: DEAD/DEAH box helicase family protein [Longimicrobiaceae bacterium]|nr:DEAD/DEAH box helicase family protein [Longimicrobiaceae bacterium]